jgi:hypothetical protein
MTVWERDVRKLFYVSIAVTVLCLMGWTANAQMRSSMKPAWEYKLLNVKVVHRGGYNAPAEQQVEETSQQVGQAMNQAGAEGWELVAIDGGTYYFKRPK